MARTYDVVVIGGGQSGLVTGYYLNRHNIDYTILDANEQLGGSWQHYYESLKLFSPAKWAELLGLDFPGDPVHYPTRYEVIDYLRDYARVHALPVQSEIRVERVEKRDGLFVIHTGRGEIDHARAVICATGPFNTPHIPALPGVDEYTGKVLHSYNYHRPEEYTDHHVVVVGSRDSAMQIAYELSQVARVTMAVRHDLKFLPKYILGISTFWWLHETGYDELPLGNFSELHGTDRIMGRQPYQTALDAGNPTPRPMFTRLTADGVIWANGEHEPVDTIIYATGYRQGMGYLAPLDALDANGRVCHHAGVSERVPGLYFVGLFGQRSHASATLRGVDKDAKFIVDKVFKHLQAQPRLTPPEVAIGD